MKETKGCTEYDGGGSGSGSGSSGQQVATEKKPSAGQAHVKDTQAPTVLAVGPRLGPGPGQSKGRCA
jgi:hypothetical protein